MLKKLIASLPLALLAAGCGSSSGLGPDAGTTTFTLKISNVLNWCDITDEGTKSTATSPPDKSYAAGTVVHLSAGPTSASFIWGYWTGTDGAAAGAPHHDTSPTTTVIMSADKTVTACCPFTNGTGC